MKATPLPPLCCPHCSASWRPRPARRETSGELPISCPRCKRHLDTDPLTCGCCYCMARRAAEAPAPRKTKKAKVLA